MVAAACSPSKAHSSTFFQPRPEQNLQRLSPRVLRVPNLLFPLLPLLFAPSSPSPSSYCDDVVVVALPAVRDRARKVLNQVAEIMPDDVKVLVVRAACKR